jgi:Uma2 family endonuclease
MLATTALMTVAEFEKLPDPPDGYYELRHGEVVLVPPSPKHITTSRRRPVFS